MSVALYEFPLCEKVRNYLRLEQLLAQLEEARHAKTENGYLHFFEVFFNLIDMIDRLDLGTDFLRDIDTHERKLLHWSQHPDIDNKALEMALHNMHKVGSAIKKNKKLGASLREERFLSNIRQRFSIPGGVNSFDLPSLYCWFKQSDEHKQTAVNNWMTQLRLISNSLEMLLSFLREKAGSKALKAKVVIIKAPLKKKLNWLEYAVTAAAVNFRW